MLRVWVKSKLLLAVILACSPLQARRDPFVPHATTVIRPATTSVAGTVVVPQAMWLRMKSSGDCIAANGALGASHDAGAKHSLRCTSAPAVSVTPTYPQVGNSKTSGGSK